MLLTALALLILQAVPAVPTADDALAHAGSLLAGGDAAQARDEYEAVLSRQPANRQAQEGEVSSSERLALVARTAKDMNGSLGILLRAQKYAPENPRLLFDMGVLEDQIGLYHDADATVLHLKQLTPGDSKTSYLVARVKLALGQLPEAEAAMREYLRAHPEDATAHYGLGRILQQGQNPVPAAQEFRKSLELKPEQTESHYQLAEIAIQSGQYPEAIAEAASVLARNPHHGGALTDTGIAHFRLKQYDEAVKWLGQAVVDAPEYQPAHYYLGLTLARLGRKGDSDRELMLATKMADEENAKASQRLRLNP